MVDEFKSIRDSFFKVLAAGINGAGDDESGRRGLLDVNLKGAKDLLGSLAGWAGKGKDEVVQLVCREIGNAMAGVLKEPIAQVLEGRKLQMTLELVPADKAHKGGKKGETGSPRGKSSPASAGDDDAANSNERSKTSASERKPRKRKTQSAT